jgi:hypothetical protein
MSEFQDMTWLTAHWKRIGAELNLEQVLAVLADEGISLPASLTRIFREGNTVRLRIRPLDSADR